jgi:2-polyprenyl-3-methyl-5-hydroxy-6-metoxy-1,4-benzoquinol methylase
MEFTGERILSNQSKLKLTFIQSLKAYVFAQDHCKDKKVLDLGCGEGYGVSYLSKYSTKITGVDYDADSMKAARRKYKAANTEFITRDIINDKLPTGYDSVVSYQTIEHFEDVDAYLKQVDSSLKKNGVFLVSTPNKDIVSYVFNPFHYHEFTVSSLENKLKKYFKKVEIYGVFGDEKVTKVRLKNQKIIKAILMLDPLNLRSKLPRTWMQKVYSIGSNIVKGFMYKKEASIIDAVNLDNFTITQKNVEKSLDLLAVCYK